MTKKKKILLIILVSLFILVIGIFFMVKIYKIEVNFLSTTNYYKTEQVNLSKKDISFFSTTLIFNKNKYIKLLEKNNPYLKVISIECKFPWKIVVHCTEREPLFYYELEDEYYILDGELKILEIKQDLNNYSLVQIREEIKETEFAAGDKILFKNDNNQKILENIYNANIQNLKTVTDFIALYKTIIISRVLSPVTLNYVNILHLEMKSGAIVQIYDADNAFTKKLQYVNLMISSLSPEEKKEGTILIFENTENKIEARYFVEE